MLCFILRASCFISCNEIHYFITELWYLFSSCSLRCGFVTFLNTRVLKSLFLLVLICSNYWGRRGTATHDGIVSLPWRQSRSYSRAFNNLSRRYQGLIMLILGFILFMVFKLLLINQKCASLCPRLPNASCLAC